MKKEHKVKLNWFMPYLEKEYRVKPEKYISHII